MLKNKVIVLTLTLSASLLIGSISALATEKQQVTTAEPGTLKSVMRGLLEDSKQVQQGILLEDFKMILAASKRIADHPTPGMATKMKLMAGMGTDMPAFKKQDSVVHNAGVALSKAANEENLSEVVNQYHTLIDGCVSCHTKFRARVAKILAQ